MIHGTVHQLKSKGFNVSQIASQLNVSRNRVYDYLAMDKETFDEWDNRKDRRKRKLDPYRDEILAWLREYPTLKASQVEDWLQERHPGLRVGESTVRLYVRDLRNDHGIRRITKEREYVAVQELPPGQQIQVDFGAVRVNAEDGTEKPMRFIAFVLSHSRYKYVEWLDRPFRVADMVRCHENAFRFFGGMAKEMVYDQDALIAVDENGGDLLLTEGFRSYVTFRGFKLYLCRTRDPESKGKVERVVQYVKGNFAHGRRYNDLADWNRRCVEWLHRTANHKRHETTKKRPDTMLALEKPHLCPISSSVSFETNLTSSVTRTVHKDNTVRYKGSRYSVPVGTYQSDGERVVHLHESTESKTIILANPGTGEIIAKHRLANERGTLVQAAGHGHDLPARQSGQTDDVYALFAPYEKAIGFLDEIVARYPRYIRDQFQIIRELAEANEGDVLGEMERLYDTGQVSANILRQNLMSGPKGIRVSTRELAPYIDVMTGGAGR